MKLRVSLSVCCDRNSTLLYKVDKSSFSDLAYFIFGLHCRYEFLAFVCLSMSALHSRVCEIDNKRANKSILGFASMNRKFL